MHSLTIYFGPTNTPIVLLFKENAKADSIYNEYVSSKIIPGEGGALIGFDDFGQSFVVPTRQINGMLLDNMDESQQAYIERGLHQARAQAKAEQRAAADPIIRESMRAKKMGPAVMSPVPGGRFNG